MSTTYTLSKRNQFLYFGIVTSGLVWLLVNLLAKGSVPTVCLFNNITGIPCPTCGTTDSITYLINGNIISAFNINPLGIPLSLFIIFLTVKVIVDRIIKKRTFNAILASYERYTKLHRKKIFFLLFVILINWIWVLARQQ